MNTYRLPNDKRTTSQQVYLKAWRKVIRQLNKKLDVVVLSFDPNFLVVNEYNQTTQIPTWLALKIVSPNAEK